MRWFRQAEPTTARWLLLRTGAQIVVFWGLFLLYTVHYGLGEGAEKSFLVTLVPEGSRGTAFGLQHAVHGLALLPANVVFGFLYTKRPEWAFGVSASLALLATVMLGRLRPSTTSSTT